MLKASFSSYKVTGLLPGEAYGITLMSKTGDRFTRNPVMENVMTAPSKVSSFNLDKVETNNAVVSWLRPEKNHSRLKAFNFIVTSSDGKYKGEFAVKNNADKTVETFKFVDLESATEYTATIKTVCVFEHLRTVSEEVPLTFCTLPEPPTNLSLEARWK